MWTRSVSAAHRCSGFRSNGPKGFGLSRAVRMCCAPALPADRITARQALDLWKKHFEEKGVAEPEHSSRYIIAHLLGAKTIECVEQQKLTEFLCRDKTEQIWKLCTRRLSRMPVQYVIEEWDFRNLTLKMRPPVFIPRPETEELVELVLSDLEKKRGRGADGDAAPCTSLEVGCGSGAISLSLLSSVPRLTAIALDRSQAAVDLTRENALRLGLQHGLRLHRADIMQDADVVLGLCGSSVSVLVSNPPYLFSEDMASLDPEILGFEDPSALDGGPDGLQVVTRILTVAPKILSDGGRVYLEVDPRHPPLVQRWAEANARELRYVETRQDISGRPRFCILQKQGP